MISAPTKSVLSVLLFVFLTALVSSGSGEESGAPIVFIVQGSVSQPGRYPCTAQETVYSVIIKAGGPGKYWNGRGNVIRRVEGERSEYIHFNIKPYHGDENAQRTYLESISVLPGDVVYLGESVP